MSLDKVSTCGLPLLNHTPTQRRGISPFERTTGPKQQVGEGGGTPARSRLAAKRRGRLSQRNLRMAKGVGGRRGGRVGVITRRAWPWSRHMSSTPSCQSTCTHEAHQHGMQEFVLIWFRPTDISINELLDTSMVWVWRARLWLPPARIRRLSMDKKKTWKKATTRRHNGIR